MELRSLRCRKGRFKKRRLVGVRSSQPPSLQRRKSAAKKATPKGLPALKISKRPSSSVSKRCPVSRPLNSATSSTNKDIGYFRPRSKVVYSEIKGGVVKVVLSPKGKKRIQKFKERYSFSRSGNRGLGSKKWVEALASFMKEENDKIELSHVVRWIKIHKWITASKHEVEKFAKKNKSKPANPNPKKVGRPRKRIHYSKKNSTVSTVSSQQIETSNQVTAPSQSLENEEILVERPKSVTTSREPISECNSSAADGHAISNRITNQLTAPIGENVEDIGATKEHFPAGNSSTVQSSGSSEKTLPTLQGIRQGGNKTTRNEEDDDVVIISDDDDDVVIIDDVDDDVVIIENDGSHCRDEVTTIVESGDNQHLLQETMQRSSNNSEMQSDSGSLTSYPDEPIDLSMINPRTEQENPGPSCSTSKDNSVHGNPKKQRLNDNITQQHQSESNDVEQTSSREQEEKRKKDLEKKKERIRRSFMKLSDLNDLSLKYKDIYSAGRPHLEQFAETLVNAKTNDNVEKASVEDPHLSNIINRELSEDDDYRCCHEFFPSTSNPSDESDLEANGSEANLLNASSWDFLDDFSLEEM